MDRIVELDCEGLLLSNEITKKNRNAGDVFGELDSRLLEVYKLEHIRGGDTYYIRDEAMFTLFMLKYSQYIQTISVSKQ